MKIGKLYINMILMYLFTSHIVAYIFSIALHESFQKFYSKNFTSNFEFGFSLLILTMFGITSFAFIQGTRLETDIDQKLDLMYGILVRLLYLIISLALILWTNDEILTANYGVLGHHNRDSVDRIAGIVIGIREVILPVMLITYYLINHNRILQIINTLLVLAFVYYETTLRFTKFTLILILLLYIFMYVHNSNKISYLKIGMVISPFLAIYISIYDKLMLLRGEADIQVGSFLVNAQNFIKRLTGYEDLYIIYSTDNIYSPNALMANVSASDYYNYEILGVDPESFHASATGYFGFFLTEYGLIIGFLSMWLTAYLLGRLLKHIAVKTKYNLTYFIFNAIVIVETIPWFMDGNIKISVPGTSSVFRLIGLICFALAFTTVLKLIGKKII